MPTRPTTTQGPIPRSEATLPNVQGRQPSPGITRRTPRVAYVAAVAVFSSSLTPSAVASLSGAADSASPALVVLVAVALLVFGAVSGVVGSLVLDVLLMLGLRVAGADPSLRQAGHQLDRSLTPLTAGVLTATAMILASDLQTAFASAVASVVMALAVVVHLGVLFVGTRGVLGRSVRPRLVALLSYAVVPAVVIVAAQTMGSS